MRKSRSLTDYNKNAEVFYALNITSVREKINLHKSSWTENMNRMQQNIFLRIEKKKGRGNSGIPMNRLIDS